MTPGLETERLFLLPLELADAEAAHDLFARWEIVRFLDHIVPWPCPADSTPTFFRDKALPEMERGEAWFWTLRLKSDPGRLIGLINLRNRENENRGFWIGLPWQGQGLMTEACDAVTAYWFGTLGLPVLRVWKAAANPASRRISEK
jgi:RimJ/RimL family protein N-acetyltransferase